MLLVTNGQRDLDSNLIFTGLIKFMIGSSMKIVLSLL